MSAKASIREASERDLAEIRQLLEQSALPMADLAVARPVFLVAREGTELVAAGAFEVFGETGLLRSVVVDDRRRGTGLGRAIVAALEAAARRRGLRELVLLTETARDFFALLGYVEIPRAGAPEPVRLSAEFRTLCPESARCMHKRLDRGALQR